VSREVLEEADACAVVPMVGMVESLNVSVAAALMLHEARCGRIAALVRPLGTGCGSSELPVLTTARVPQPGVTASAALVLHAECTAGWQQA
jgi:hypothetical protein